MNENKFFSQKWIALALGLTMTLVAMDSPRWVAAFCILTFLLRWLIDLGLLKPISKFLTNSLAIGWGFGVYLEYQNLFSQDASSVFLAGLCALKMLDYRSTRDVKFLFLLGLLLVSLRPLFSVELGWAVPSFIAFYFLWLALLDLQKNSNLKLMSKIVIWSLPLTAFLFFVFPRFILPWAQRQSTHTNTLGFSDELNPGSVETLALNSSPVFRVKFDSNDGIRTSQLYWRGSVMRKSQGLKWSTGDQEIQGREPNQKNGLHYDVLMEPDGHNYLFSLDRPLQLFSRAMPILRFNYSVFKTPVFHDKDFAYQGISDLSASSDDPYSEEDLQIPEQSYRVQNLVKQIISDKRLNENTKGTWRNRRIQALDRFFVEQGFFYTLSPGSYRTNSIDEFVFKRKLGFCEHFAGAYGTLARSLGIPSRLIVGFQGGKYNSLGDFWQINTTDAHVWVEVFIDDHWQRKDPTELVAPLRIEMGAYDFFNLSESQRRLRTPKEVAGAQTIFDWAPDVFSTFFANLNYRWTLFFLDFNSTVTIQSLFSFFRGWLPLVLIAILILFFLPMFFRRSKSRRLTLSREVMNFVLSEFHDKALVDMTPLRAIQKISHGDQTLRAFLKQITAIYSLEVYQELDPSTLADNSEIRQLKKDWRKLKPLLLKTIRATKI